MSQLQESIAKFRKMANDDPENDLGHYRLGQLLMEDKQFEEAVKSLRRTLALNPDFSRAYQFLGTSLIELGRRDEAVTVLKEGYAVADRRGDVKPRDEMAALLKQLGEQPPTLARPAAAAGGEAGGFQCRRPGCFAGRHARQLPRPPINDEIGKEIYQNVCADCWQYWLRDVSIKVINETRIDLSTAEGQRIYDQIMRQTLGLE
jgi:tetratricopeptide (TPR) repeat protein